jgi:hypothetical protein
MKDTASFDSVYNDLADIVLFDKGLRDEVRIPIPALTSAHGDWLPLDTSER